jgi:glycosyltransferase involved in cell wall biosynthesis
MGLPARVCIGMPVYNGQKYVAAAIESILNQTFTDFELVVSDNASTDETPDICQAIAARDSRLKYSRLPENLGANHNYERVYRLGHGQYFKWAAHDDLLAPDFLKRCVEALDADASAVLAYPRAHFIDENGAFIKGYNVKLPTDSDSPFVRFNAIVTAPHKITHNFEIFGLMRRSATDLIPQQGMYAACDRVFLSRLTLYGKFIEVPEVLFLSRFHPDQSIHTLPRYMQKKRTWVSRIVGHGQLPPPEWFDRKYTGRITFPEWRLMWEYMCSARYGWLNTRQRMTCVGSVVKRQFMHGNWARMVRDFVLAGDKLAARVAQTVRDSRSPEHAAHSNGNGSGHGAANGHAAGNGNGGGHAPSRAAPAERVLARHG